MPSASLTRQSEIVCWLVFMVFPFVVKASRLDLFGGFDFLAVQIAFRAFCFPPEFVPAFTCAKESCQPLRLVGEG